MHNLKESFNLGLADIKKLGVRLVQHEDEFYWLFQKVHELQPKIYFQIGSFQGACEIVLSRACAENAIIVSIDNGTEGRKREPRIEAVHASSEFLNQHGYRSFVIEGDSSDELTIKKAYGLLNEEMPDFVYIDGGHEYEQARNDLKNYFVSGGGLVALHDINLSSNKEIEVWRLWRDFKDHQKVKGDFAFRHDECILHDKNGGVGLIYY